MGPLSRELAECGKCRDVYGKRMSILSKCSPSQ